MEAIMADITKCVGGECKKKEKCYRYTAPDNEYWQSYSDFYNPEDDCEAYWPDEELEERLSED
jgi:hypothetical protein